MLRADSAKFNFHVGGNKLSFANAIFSAKPIQ